MKLDKLAAAKIIFDRGRQYAGIAEFVLVIFLAVRELQRTNLSGLVPRTIVSAPVGLLLSLIAVFVVGYVDYKIFYPQELERSSWKNPVTQQTFSKLDEILERLKKAEKRIETKRE